jgi:DNA-binding beta-propeller fold protein YncE
LTVVKAPYPIILGFIDGAPAIYSLTVMPDQFLTLDFIDGAPAIYDLTVVKAPYPITLGLIDAVPAIYDLTVVKAPYPITLGLIDGAPAIYDLTVAHGLLRVTIDLIDATPAIYDIVVERIDVGAETQFLTLGVIQANWPAHSIFYLDVSPLSLFLPTINPITDMSIVGLGVLTKDSYSAGSIVSHSGTHVYVTNEGLDTVQKLLTSDMSIVGTASVTQGSYADPCAICIDSSDAFVYTVNHYSHAISKIQTSDMSVSWMSLGASHNPVDICIDSSDAYIYIANEIANNVERIRLSDMTVTGECAIGNTADAIVISPDDAYVYVSSFLGNFVKKVRLSDMTVVGTFNYALLEQEPWGLTITSDGAYIYVVSHRLGRIDKIRTSDMTLVGDGCVLPIAGEYPSAASPWDICISSDDAHLYVQSSTASLVIHVRTSDMSVVSYISTKTSPINEDGYPTAVSISPDDQFVFVSNSEDDRLLKVFVGLSSPIFDLILTERQRVTLSLIDGARDIPPLALSVTTALDLIDSGSAIYSPTLLQITPIALPLIDGARVLVAEDTFTEAGTGVADLSTHTPELGGLWVRAFGGGNYPDAAFIDIDKDNDWAEPSGSIPLDAWDYGEAVYRVATIADGFVEGRLDMGSNGGKSGLVIRQSGATYYDNFFVFFGGSLYRMTGGTISYIGNHIYSGPWYRMEVSGTNPTKITLRSSATREGLDSEYGTVYNSSTAGNQMVSGYVGILGTAEDQSGMVYSGPVDGFRAYSRDVIPALSVAHGLLRVAIDLIDAAPALYDIEVVGGGQYLTFDLIDGVSAVYDLTVAIGRQYLTLDLIDGAPAVYDLTVAIGRQYLTLDLIDGAPAVYDLTVAPINQLDLWLVTSLDWVYGGPHGPRLVLSEAFLLELIYPQDVTLDLIDEPSGTYPLTVGHWFPPVLVSLGLIVSVHAIYNLKVKQRYNLHQQYTRLGFGWSDKAKPREYRRL